MGKPRMIIVIRHAQSEGNKNRDIHQTIPDHRVKLTSEGWDQALEAGRRLRKLLRADDTLHFFTSPYRRTRETTEGILQTLTGDDPSPSPFPRHKIKVYEEPRLREQDFGNFQPCSAEMERMWQERADYGHFFYRIPNGESAADAYDRISGFNESLWRYFKEDDFASVCVLVTHGLMSRVFLMKWYHFSVEYFEDLRNINHCEFLTMRKSEDSGKYILENTLRTWSELKRERAALAAAKDKAGTDKEKDVKEKEEKKLDRIDKLANQLVSSHTPFRKRWGGCPNGCDHGRSKYPRENSMHAMHVNSPKASAATSPAPDSLLQRRTSVARRWQNSSDEDEHDPRGGVLPAPASAPSIDVQRSLEEMVSSPDGTPSFISLEDRMQDLMKSPDRKNPALLRTGRDFGGSQSGHTSAAGSDGDISTEESLKYRPNKKIPIQAAVSDKEPRKSLKREESAMGRGVRADALGDAQSDAGSIDEETPDEELEDLEEAEEKDRSIKGSVY